MIQLPGLVTLFIAFVILVVLGAAVRAVWTARANGPPVRPTVFVGIFLLLAIATAWVVVPALSRNAAAKYPWQLATPFVGVSYTRIDPNGSAVRKNFDEAAARATTVVRINMNQWPAGCSTDGPDWLAEPDIAYASSSITITMRAKPEFDAGACVGWYDFWGQALEIHLSEPLNGRALFDGSGIPTAARPYP